MLYEHLGRERLPELLPLLRSRLVEALSGTYALTEGLAHVGASVGLVAAEQDELDYSLLGRADLAMYAEKAAHKAAHEGADTVARTG